MADPPPFDPAKPFTTTPVVKTPPPFDPTKPFTTTATADIATAAPPEGESGLGELWLGLMRMREGAKGEDTSRMGRFGMGAADPYYGGAQIGARMMAQSGGGVPEQAGAPAGPDLTKEVDTAVQQREEGYQQREKAAGLSGGLGSEWARLLGNVAGTAPLAALPAGGATVPGRIGMAALGGGAGAAAMPVTSGNFVAQKALQAGGGALGGAVLGGAAEAAAPLVRGAIRGLRPSEGPMAPAAQPMGAIPPDVGRQVQQQFQRAAPMSSGGMRGSGDIAEQQANRLSAVQSIVAEKPNLSFETPKGEVTGRLPQTRQELSEAFTQVKNTLFQKWDALTKRTESAPMQTTSPIIKHNEAWQDSQRAIAEANQDLREANTALTLAKAQQSSAGNNVYRSNAANAAFRSAQTDARKATEGVARAERAADRARADLQKPWVDLKPVANELKSFAGDEGLRTTPGSEAVIDYARKQAAKYGEQEAATPSAVQRAITNANKSLESFYKNPGYESAARAGVDAMVANNLRRGLDETISKATGPGYQQLKLQYGALAGAERDVTRAAVRSMGNTPEAKFLEGLTNVGTAEELIRGLTSMRLEPIMRGVIVRAGLALRNRLVNPDRDVRLMFQNAERGMMGQGGPVGTGAMSITGLSGVAGGEAVPQMTRGQADRGAAERARRRDLYETVPVQIR